MEMKHNLLQDFSGIIACYQNKKKIIEKAVGFRDLPNNCKNETDTLFGTASAGKAFVAVGIMQLVDEGQISLNQEIGSILKMNLGSIAPTITIYELLTHTSGIQDYFDEEEMEEYTDLWQDTPNYRIRKNADLFPLFFYKPLHEERRGKFIYNNSGYVMLAAVIEEITGKLFDEYLNEHVFVPAKMERTGYYALDRLPSNTANAYCFDKESQEYYTNIYSVDVKGTGAGGCFTTALDVHRFWEAFVGGELVEMDTVRQMLTKQATNGQETYGLGFWLKKESEEVYLPYFEGMDPGICFFSMYDYVHDIEVTAISNKEDNVWKIGIDYYNQIIG